MSNSTDSEQKLPMATYQRPTKVHLVDCHGEPPLLS